MPIPAARIITSTVVAISIGVVVGCARSVYRRAADREVYATIEQKAAQLEPDALPSDPSIDPTPEARFFDPFDPDHPPMPPDDPTSHELMVKVDGKRGASEWQQPPNPDAVHNELWRAFLPTDKSGEAVLDLKTAVRVAVNNSRDYQDQREELYLSALDVTFQRFKFAPQFALGTQGTGIAKGAFLGGKGPKAVQQLPVLTDGSVRWLGATGGEMLLGFANSLVWDWDGNTMTRAATSAVNFSIVQPLLRFGGRARVLETLTNTERKLLANVRQMEQFRRGFYVRTVSGRNSGEGPTRSGSPGSTGLGLIAGTPAGRTGAPRADGFLGVLEEQQRIRNLEANVTRLRQSLDQLEAAFDAGRIPSRLQVDQARQALFNGQSSLLSARAAYETRLDSYKIELGLPPELPLLVRDTLLDRYNPSDPAVPAIDRQLDEIEAEVRTPERIRSAADLQRNVQRLLALQPALKRQLATARSDAAHLKELIPTRREQLRAIRTRPDIASLSVDPRAFDGTSLDRKLVQFQERLATQEKELAEIYAQLSTFSAQLPMLELDVARSRLSEIASDVSGFLLSISLDQTATRLESATLPSIDLDEKRAMEIARENRLDWQNARARLVDAWRRIGFFANPLMSGLDVTVDGNMGTTRNDPTRFDARTGLLRLGLRFDTPLSRLAERNDYREALVDYQRARRDYMLFEDRVSQSVRNTLRIVQLSQFNFELRRSAVQVAISQVDLARLRLEEPPRPGVQAQFGATTARDLVSALNDLLDAQNDFLSLQVGYNVLRLVLDFELGTMQLDNDGLWIDPGAINAESLAANQAKWHEIQSVEKYQQTPSPRLFKSKTPLSLR